MKDELQPRILAACLPACLPVGRVGRAKPRGKKRAPRKHWFLRMCFPLQIQYNAELLLKKIAAAVGRPGVKEVGYGQAVVQFEFAKPGDALSAATRGLGVLVDVAATCRVIAVVSNQSSEER